MCCFELYDEKGFEFYGLTVSVISFFFFWISFRSLHKTIFSNVVSTSIFSLLFLDMAQSLRFFGSSQSSVWRHELTIFTDPDLNHYSPRFFGLERFDFVGNFC